MANEFKPIKTIPREEAVFRLDENGVWYNRHNRFTHRKIINYFHSAIKKDHHGFFLEQEHQNFIEKVYFPYEDTALFVFRVIKGNEIILHLNTGKQIKLEPNQLFIRNDNLYIQYDGDIVKFNQNALLAVAGFIDYEKDRYMINIGGKRHPIPRKDQALSFE